MKTAPVIFYDTLKDLVQSQPKAQENYDRSAVLLVRDARVSYDKEFFSKIFLPHEYKKIGTHDGVILSPFVISGMNLVRNPKNPLTKIIRDDILLSKIVYEFCSLDVQMRKFAASTFPGFRRATAYNCTFRLVPTREEGMHFDYFMNGRPFEEKAIDRTRIKIFLNIDAEPRIWKVGPTLQEFLLSSAQKLPRVLPSNLNTLTYLLDRIGYLEECESKIVEIPAGGAVIANGATVAHEVVYGNRMVAIEITGVNEKHMQGFRGERIEVLNWISEAGFDMSSDNLGILETLKGMPSGIERARARVV